MTQPDYQTQSLSDNGQWAQRYAGLGWRVLPLWPQALCATGQCSSPACKASADAAPDSSERQKVIKSWGKHPRLAQWSVEASSDTQQVVKWWTEQGDAGIGIATGEGSGIVVVDIDPRNGGLESWQQIESEVIVPDTLRQETSGGFHLVYAYDGQITHKLAPLPGVEVLTNGQQVVVPPTICGYGQARIWLPRPVASIGELGARLLRLHGERSAVVGNHERAERRNGAVPAQGKIGAELGKQDDGLTSYIGRQRDRNPSDPGAVWILAYRWGKACVPPMEDEDIHRVFNSVMKYVRPAIHEEGAAWAAATEELPEEETEKFEFPLNDLGNARRLMAYRGEDLLHVTGLGWLCWDGHKWEQSGHTAREWASTYPRRHCIDREMTMAESTEEETKIVKWGISSQNDTKVRATLSMAEPMVHHPNTDAMDANPLILPVLNGTVDFETGKFYAHRRADKATMLANVEYDPDAKAPEWERFLRLAVPDDEDRDFLLRALGYTLTGLTDAKCFFMLYGPTNNGKSTLLDSIASILGPYAANSDDEVFIESRYGGSHKQVLARLGGRRMAVLSELAEGGRLKESIVKKVTGDGTLTANFMRENSFEFTPRMKLWVGTNHQPTLSDVGEAMRNRPRLIEFPHNFALDEKTHLSRSVILKRLAAESSGMLNLMLAGQVEYQRVGLKPTAKMMAAQDIWFDENDVMGMFLAECTYPSLLQDGQGTKMAALYDTYTSWAKLRGIPHTWSMQTFRAKLKGRGDAPSKKMGTHRTAVELYGVSIRLATEWVGGWSNGS